MLTVDGVQHEVWLQDLPAVVESYKTLDDANLVKITDIGQVGAGSSCCQSRTCISLPFLHQSP